MRAAVAKLSAPGGWRLALAGVSLALAAALSGSAHAQQAKPPVQAAPATPAAPAAQAGGQMFSETDAGVYTVLDKQGQLTSVAYRFYQQAGKWIAEERGADGGWTAFKCEANCEIKPLPQEELVRLLGKAVDDMSIGCVGNANFAVCRYVLKKNPTALRHMMMVQTKEGIALVHLLWTAGL
jgi:hypothetical protein